MSGSPPLVQEMLVSEETEPARATHVKRAVLFTSTVVFGGAMTISGPSEREGEGREV